MSKKSRRHKAMALANMLSMDYLFRTILSTVPNTCVRLLVRSVERLAVGETKASWLRQILLWHEYDNCYLPSGLLEFLKSEKARVEAEVALDKKLAAKTVALLSAQKLPQEAGSISENGDFDLARKIIDAMAGNRKVQFSAIDVKEGTPFIDPRTGEPLDLSSFLASEQAGNEIEFLFAIDDGKGRWVVVDNPWSIRERDYPMQKRIMKENPRFAARLRAQAQKYRY